MEYKTRTGDRESGEGELGFPGSVLAFADVSENEVLTAPFSSGGRSGRDGPRTWMRRPGAGQGRAVHDFRAGHQGAGTHQRPDSSV